MLWVNFQGMQFPIVKFYLLQKLSFMPSLIFSSFSVKMILWNIHYMYICYSNCMVSDSMVYILLLFVKLKKSLLPQNFTK